MTEVKPLAVMKSAVSTIYTVGFIITLFSRAEGNRGYSYADCTYVKQDYDSTYYGGRCFCYTSSAIKWKDYWSTFQVQVSGREDVVIVYPMEPRICRDGDSLLKLATCLMEHHWPSSVQKEDTMDIPLVEEEVCFMVRSPRASAEYKLQVSKQRFNRMRFFLFLSGLTLFFFAGAVCRSSLFFYIFGISLGMVSISVFLLLVLKNFIPNRGLFLVLFSFGSGLSYLAIQKLMNEQDEIMRLYWRELLGYLLVSGFMSMAVCYRLGPITSKRTLSVATWTLQAVGMVVACHGVTYAPVSWMLLAALLGFKILPLMFALILAVSRKTCWLLSSFLSLFQRSRWSKPRLLTEEEYREQAEKHTKASLEELRRYCTNPGFPAWDTVLRLRNPQRFAEFLRSGAHITPSELQSHELLDLTRTTPTSEDVSDDEINAYTKTSPSPNSYPPPLLFHPAVPPLPALPCPPVHTAPICPYPLIPHTQAPERPLTDDDEPF